MKITVKLWAFSCDLTRKSLDKTHFCRSTGPICSLTGENRDLSAKILGGGLMTHPVVLTFLQLFMPFSSKYALLMHVLEQFGVFTCGTTLARGSAREKIGILGS